MQYINSIGVWPVVLKSLIVCTGFHSFDRRKLLIYDWFYNLIVVHNFYCLQFNNGIQWVHDRQGRVSVRFQSLWPRKQRLDPYWSGQPVHPYVWRGADKRTRGRKSTQERPWVTLKANMRRSWQTRRCCGTAKQCKWLLVCSWKIKSVAIGLRCGHGVGSGRAWNEWHGW